MTASIFFQVPANWENLIVGKLIMNFGREQFLNKEKIDDKTSFEIWAQKLQTGSAGKICFR